jgi:hypothetical protein
MTGAIDYGTGPASDTYATSSEAEADRARQQQLLDALGGWRRALRRDRCGAWIVVGTRGRIFTWGDGETWLLHYETGSERADTYAFNRLLALPCCAKEPGWRVRLTRLPTPDQAEDIRDVLGIRKRRTISDEERERLKSVSGLARYFGGYERQSGERDQSGTIPHEDDDGDES